MARWRSLDPEQAEVYNTGDEKKPHGRRRHPFHPRQPARWNFSQLLGYAPWPHSTSLARRRSIIKLSKVIVACATGLILLHAFFRREERFVDVLDYVDPLIGSQGEGHVFAGATLPFGMAKAVADVTGKDNLGGFATDGSPVAGFSSLHDSGSGALPSMGNFPIFLQASCPDIETCPMLKETRPQAYVPSSLRATPGYFALTLDSGIEAEMTASERSSLFRFSNSGSTRMENPVLLMDASDLSNSFGLRSIVLDAEKERLTAEGTFKPSFGQGTYRSYQCVDFRGAQIQDYGVFNDTGVSPSLTSIDDSINRFWAFRQGMYVRFEDLQAHDRVHVRVGLSWLSVERACENAEREIADFDMERVVETARQAWREKLKPINVDSKGVQRRHLRNFWSAVYRTFLNPQDYTGENQLWDSGEPYYDSWYCIWDTFRGVHPFYMLVDVASQSRMVRSLIDIYKHTGWLPECRMSFCKGYTQGGSNADVVIVDSFVKNLTGVDWDEAYAALIKDAELQPLVWDLEGRGGIRSWKQLGYVPYGDIDRGGLKTRSVSRTVEYAYNDFCIAAMANATGRAEDFEKYAGRAGNWRNVYDPDHESMGFTGFPQPRYANGSFGYQDATLCSPLNDFQGCYLVRSGHETYEGSPWLYLFYVPGDIQGLIDLLGGREAFLRRLDALHDSGVLYIGDEQSFLTAFLYHYAGRPGLSAKRIRGYIPSVFNDRWDGIPGNDDSGAMGTLVLFSMMGVFPNAGQNVYLIVPPFFPSVSITNPETGKTAVIKNVNFEPSYKRAYIQSARLNGRPYTKNWIDHSFFLNGGTLELTLGKTEGSWGTGQDDVPPSLSTGLYFG